jgi:serine/threonine protein kinase
MIRIIEKIGEGNQGKVYLCEGFNDEHPDGTLFVSKKGKERMIQKEFKALYMLRGCAHIIQLKKIVKLSDRSCIPLVYYPNKDLLRFVQCKGNLNVQLAKTLFRQLLVGLNTTHERGIVHRDIKLENILVDEHYNVHIGDYGLSSIVEPFSKTAMVVGKRGTRHYMAPEVAVDTNIEYDGFKADIWSIGCVFFMMLTGNNMWGEHGARDEDGVFSLWKQGNRGLVWEAHQKRSEVILIGEIISFFEKIFKVDPSERVSVQELLCDAWLNEDLLNDDQLYAEMDELKNQIILSNI